MSSRRSTDSTASVAANKDSNAAAAVDFMNAMLDEALDELDDDDNEDSCGVGSNSNDTGGRENENENGGRDDENQAGISDQKIDKNLPPSALVTNSKNVSTGPSNSHSPQQSKPATDDSSNAIRNRSSIGDTDNNDKRDHNEEKFRSMFRDFVHGCTSTERDADDADENHDDDSDKEEDELSKFMEQVQIHLVSVAGLKSKSAGKKGSNSRTSKALDYKSSPGMAAKLPRSMDDAQQSLAAILQEMSTVRDGNDIGELMDDGNTKIPDGFGQDEEKILEGIFQSLGAMAGGGLGGVGGGSSGDGGAIDPDEFIDGMMEQILSKDLMYAPMKAVTEKFPEWLDRHKDDLTSEEYDQRRRQYMCFQKLVDVYESQDDVETTENKSSNKDINNRLIELMQEIQEYGQPPAEIVNEVAPGLELDENGMPKVDGVSPFGPTGTGDDCTVM